MDPRKLEQAVTSVTVDGTASSLFASYDSDLSLLYLWGKGDSTLRAFEATGNSLLPCSEHKSTQPQSGIALLPKSSAKWRESEIDVLLKLTPSTVDVVRVLVPRPAGGHFDADIWPATWNRQPRGQAAEFLSSGNLQPAETVSLEGSE